MMADQEDNPVFEAEIEMDDEGQRASDGNEDSDASDREDDFQRTPWNKRVRSRKNRDVPEVFRQEADTVTKSFRDAFRTGQITPEMTDIMRRLALLIQESVEEYMNQHRDPADSVPLSDNITPKLYLLIEKFQDLLEDNVRDFLSKICRTYICADHGNPDLQYYAAIILYGSVFCLRADGIDSMRVFVDEDVIFNGFLSMIRLEGELHPTFRLPTSHAREVRALLCSVMGSCFENVVLADIRAKVLEFKTVIRGYFDKLRQYLSKFPSGAPHPAVSQPASPDPVFTTPVAPRPGSKRKLDRSRSQTESVSSSVKKKKPKTAVEVEPPKSNVLDMDENSTASSWAEYERLQIGELSQNFRVVPMDENLEIRLILDLLVGMATLGEFHSAFYELDALGLCAVFLDCRKQLNIRILGQSIHMLANLLEVQRFVTKFMDMPGRFHQLIRLPYPSIPSVFAVKALRNIVHSSEFALETIIKFPDLVNGSTSFMAEAGLNSGYMSPRKWGAEFFTKALEYRVFMDAFDEPKIDGVRLLLNMITKYEFFWKRNGDLEVELTTDEAITSASATLNSAFQALICYFTTDMVIKMDLYRVDSLRRLRDAGKEPPSEMRIPRHNFSKAVHLEKDELDEVRDYMLTHVPLWRSNRDRVLRFVNLGGMERLLRILEKDQVEVLEQREFSLTPFHKSVLEIAEKCMLSKCAQEKLLAHRTTPPPGASAAIIATETYSGITMILKIAVEYFAASSDVMVTALHVLSNCVYGIRTGLSSGEQDLRLSQRKAARPFFNEPPFFDKIVSAFRQHNMLREMLKILTDPTGQGDLHRALACKVLVGMAKNASCRQVLRELMFFKGGELQVLLREPLSHGHADYIKFEKYATELLETIYETKLRPPIPVNLAEFVGKQDILNRSRITFSSQEVDHLLLGHLQSRGLKKTASSLMEEVGLRGSGDSVRHINQTPTKRIDGESTSENGNSSKFMPTFHSRTTAKYLIDATDMPPTVAGVPELRGVIANNFRAQHAQCENPIAYCPPFSLKRKHRCPAPTRVKPMYNNLNYRNLFRTDFPPPFGRVPVKRLDRNHIFSRVAHIGSFEIPPDAQYDPHEGCLSVCFVGQRQNEIIMGCGDGYILGFHIDKEEQSLLYNHPSFYKMCHEYECDTQYLKTMPKNPDRFISCCTAETATIWSILDQGKPIRNGINVVKQYEEVSFMEMPNFHEHIALGEIGGDAFIFDLETSEKLVKFVSPDWDSRYENNRPAFHPTDDLITHHGMLFDRRSGDMVHKFDMFERNTNNGYFHPNGNSIIIDSEVWDLRNYRMLSAVPALHKSALHFNSSGDVIIASKYVDDTDEAHEADYTGVLTVVDAKDYTTINVIELKRKFQAIGFDNLDNNLAVAEPFNESIGMVGRLLRIGIEKGIAEVEEEPEDEELDYDESDDDMGDYYDDDDYEEWEEIPTSDNDAEDDNEEIELGSSDTSSESGEEEWTTDEEGENHNGGNFGG